MKNLSFLSFVLCFGPLSTAAAADPAPGLVLNFAGQGGGADDARLARSVALYVPAGQPPTPFLPPGRFRARWEGKLLLEKRSRLIFTLEGTGSARLLIDGEVLVEAIGKPNESERLSSGEHDIVCEYESPADGGDAQLRLFWEGREFHREPVPAMVLAHGPADAALAARLQLRRGRDLVAAKRCVNCHRGPLTPTMPELGLAAPSLEGVGARLQQGWLARWIADPQALRPSAHMPVLFQADAEKNAADIAAYLAAGSPDSEAPSATTAEQALQGGHLFHQQGCIACHTLAPAGDAARISLAQAGAKFRPGAMARFLREPAEFHPGTRMPTFGFSAGEAAAIEGFLRTLADGPGPAGAPAGDADIGKKLLSSSGCLNCHTRTDTQSTLPPARPLAELSSADCTAAQFGLSDPEHADLAAFLADKPALASLGRVVPAEFAQRQFESLRCNACHSRDGALPQREQFAAEVAHLEPPGPDAAGGRPALRPGAPPLDHLGLKLRPEWRARLFAGQVEPKVRHWLAARMPAFPSRAADLATGFDHAVGLPGTSPASPPPDPEKIRIGAAMTGVGGGLACGTCHGIGDRPPVAVFEGEGPNLGGAARLSQEYFRLWMENPPRVWPGTIMPKYAVDGTTPLTQHYDGDAARQFDAIYHYLRSLSDK